MSSRTIVLEIGSKYIKGGYAGDAAPKFITQSFLTALASNTSRSSSSSSNSSSISSNSNSNCIILDNNEYYHQYMYERISSILSKNLTVKVKECRILVIEKIFCCERFRNELIKVLLVDVGVSMVSFQPDLLMPILTSVNHTSRMSGYSASGHGIVIDIGESETRCMSFAFGRPVIHTIKVASVGVKQLFESYLNHVKTVTNCQENSTLDDRDLYDVYCCFKYSHDEVVDDDEDKITLHPSSNLSSAVSVSSTITDYDNIWMIAELLVSCLAECNFDNRIMVASNIIFCGGGSAINNLASTICQQATEMIAYGNHKLSTVKSTIKSLPNEKLMSKSSEFSHPLLAWIGGSLFASISSNDTKFLSLADYLSLSPHSPDWMSLDKNDWRFSMMRSP